MSNREYFARYRQGNKEAIRERNRRYYAANKVQISLQQSLYRKRMAGDKRTQELRLARERRYRSKSRLRIAAKARQSYEMNMSNNQFFNILKTRKWKEHNPTSYREYVARSRLKQALSRAGVNLPSALIPRELVLSKAVWLDVKRAIWGRQ